ncbi:antitoxin component YwqK of YwqJK toxin-antitoxin module [Pedobacter cryoconitis]|uniref:Antitoxin component YwqK of YwqJK toxin-antitoxin module n=1 Tax=Pedobacter cryoconitis TaxID=188932 RepID=A0A7W8YQW7_9SPHI|nr:hypothetical protein [Pedobacter cryoconitis]MBB5620119.1 antitoxin component YwqK of YwqJK toxin-antitoxin module [Pedobacter cryoconitis]MBB5649139.1 antitoxin component YwqK of YwqJK toxin-antitoxin module [Pedobacter cryoconitis]
MRIYLLALFLITALVFPAKAQKKFSSYIENYQHTINYADHKVTLHVLPADRTLKYTDLTKSYYWYSSNQIKITQGGFSGKLLHGLYSNYYENKNLQEQGNFNMGLKSGEWKNWTEDGKLISDVNFINGVPEGDFYKYDNQGKLVERGRNVNGKVDGDFVKYQGDSTLSVRYKNGIVVPAKVRSAKKPGWIKRFFKKKMKSEDIIKPV